MEYNAAGGNLSAPIKTLRMGRMMDDMIGGMRTWNIIARRTCNFINVVISRED